jgi:carbonic anhydrase
MNTLGRMSTANFAPHKFAPHKDVVKGVTRMKKLSSVIVSASLVFALHAYAADTPQPAGHAIHWGYTGADSPEKWGDLDASYAACKTGKSQSPIDITAATPTAVGGIAFNYQTTPLHMVNNGHTIQVNANTNSSITVQGKEYKLVQFHFHSPSEHMISGKHYAMEVHLVHKNDAGQLAVVGVLMQPGKPHALLQTLVEQFPAEVNQEKVVPTVRLNPKDLLPSETQYYHYDGSLTTPPCSEGVAWFVMKTPIEVSAAQVEQFTAAMHHNARPVQPLHERVVLEKP